jgi:molybdopterin synthase sulfur carrier subunit
MAKVLLFGPLRDLAGWREREFVGVSDLATLLNQLDPDLAKAVTGPGVQIAVDKTIIRGTAFLSPRSEVAFLPPMSGG